MLSIGVTTNHVYVLSNKYYEMKLLILKVLNTSNDKNNLFTWFAHHFLFGLGCFLESLFPLQKACQTNICITSSAVIWRRNSNWQKTAHVELSSYSSKIPTNSKNKKWDQEFKHSTYLLYSKRNFWLHTTGLILIRKNTHLEAILHQKIFLSLKTN